MSEYFKKRLLSKPVHERPVDALAGKGSTAYTLKRQREAMESGDASLGRPVIGGDTEETVANGYRKRKMTDED